MKNNLVLVQRTEELEEVALAYRQEHFDFGEHIMNGSELFDKIERMNTNDRTSPK